jgi:EpsI family protein
VSVAAVARSSLRGAIFATMIMLGAVIGAWALSPARYWYDELGRPDLEQIIPRQFGEWVASDRAPALFVNPELSETLRVIYTQTLSRVYVNRKSGQAIMLSIALGIDQAGTMQLHLPEGCYRTQGLVVDSERREVLQSAAGPINLTRFESHSATRREPVSYWIRIGKRNIRDPLERNLARLALAAQGYVADGLLFRVSEISRDAASSFELQDRFITDLLSVVNPAERAALVGSAAS